MPGHTLLLGAEDADSAEDNAQRYAQSQRQRRLECRVRAAKREAITLEAAGDKEGFDAAALRVRRAQGDLRAFEKETGRTHYGDRSQVFGYNRSVAGKATAAAKKYSAYHYHKDGTIVVTDDWKGPVNKSFPKKYRPFAVIETHTKDQTDRTFYDENAVLLRQTHSGPHKNPKQHTMGKRGEHGHTFIWLADGSALHARRELTDEERKESGDIL